MTARACASSTLPACRCRPISACWACRLHRLVRHPAHLQAQGRRDGVRVGGDGGAVGQVAGQLAKLSGARVVGTPATRTSAYGRSARPGYDACFNHRTERDYGAVLDKLCPQGIDADFENVGGRLFHAVFERMNNFGRIASAAPSRSTRTRRRWRPAEDVRDRPEAAHDPGVHRQRPCRPDARVHQRGRRAAEGRQGSGAARPSSTASPRPRRPSWACSRARTRKAGGEDLIGPRASCALMSGLEARGPPRRPRHRGWHGAAATSSIAALRSAGRLAFDEQQDRALLLAPAAWPRSR